MSGQIIPVNLAQESYKSRSSLSSCMKLYNLYSENVLASSPFKVPVIFNTPNPEQWIDLGLFFPIYGFVVMNNNLYTVCGQNVYKIDLNKNVTLIGSLATTPNFVEMTENGLQVTILTSTGQAYYYTESTDVFGEITSPNYFLSSSVCTVGGFTIFSKQESGEFFMSDLRETTTYPATYVATAEALSDNIVRVTAFNNQLYIFGTESVEIWQFTGIGDPPFQRVNGAFFQQGVIAKRSVVTDVTGIYFLGNDGIVYNTNSYIPTRVSTFGIENEISKLDRIDDAIAYIYTQAGHKFYCLTFVTEQRTFVFDITTQLWHERGSFDSNISRQQHWNCFIGINFNNKVITNGDSNGKLYYLDQDKYKEDTKPVLAEIISSIIYKDYNNFNIDNFIVVMDSGVGLNDGQGSDPKVMLSFSIDGGLIWQDRAPSSIGKIGKYRQRINWIGLGLSREFIIRLRVSDPVKRSFLAAYVQITEGGF